MRTMPSVHGASGGFDPDPGLLWPLGDTVAMAALGLLEVSLRDLGLRWRVLGVEELEVLELLAGSGRPGGGRPPVRVDCRGLCRCMRESRSGDWPGLVEEFVQDLMAARRRSVPEPEAEAEAEPVPDPTGASWPAPVPESVPDSSGASSSVSAPVPDPAGASWSAPVPESVPVPSATGTSWTRVEHLLRSRIVSAAVLPALLLPGQGTEAVVCQPVAEGLVEVLEVSSGESLRLVRAGELAQWAVTGPAAVLRARENVWADGELSRRQFAAEGAMLVELSGPGQYATTHLHWLHRYLAAEPGWSEHNGALVALPHRRLLAAHVIESAAVEHAAGALARFAFRQFETCPGPVSDQLYWWRADQLTRLPSDSVGETLQIFPTEAFAVLLDRLRAEP
jgi:hypothetical protein